MSLHEAAIAANRFGLGARPGELRAIAGDPRGWLRAQLVAETTLPAPLKALPGTAEDQTAFFRWLRDYGRDARNPGGTPAMGVEQSYVRALLPVYACAVEARFQTGARFGAQR